MTMPLTSRFSVVIVNYNGGDMLLDCVRSVTESGVFAAQVVVVDNGSRDDSMARLEAAWPDCMTVHMGCNAGFARAVNRGLAKVKTEFALLLNNDARLAPDSWAAFGNFFDQHSKAAFLGGRLLYEDGRLQNAVAAFPRLYAEFLPRALLRVLWPARYQGRPKGDSPVRVESVIGAMFAVRMAAVGEFGALDEDFFFFLEETEWCHRASQRGWEVWHVPAARAIHAQGATAKKHNALARIEFHRSRLIYFRKTAPAWYPLSLVMACLKAGLNAFSNNLLAVLTLGLVPRARSKALISAQILLWYLRGRPADVGLPDKCPTILAVKTSAGKSAS